MYIRVNKQMSNYAMHLIKQGILGKLGGFRGCYEERVVDDCAGILLPAVIHHLGGTVPHQDEAQKERKGMKSGC